MVLHVCASNLRGFAVSRPPLVVFTLCLAALALATLCLARLVDQAGSIRNPDVTLDWNVLLQRLAGLELCALPDTTGRGSGEPVEREESAQTGLAPEQLEVSVQIGLARELLYSNKSLLQGEVPPALLGLHGDQQNLRVSLRAESNWTVCVTLTGLRSVLPSTLTPPSCNKQEGADSSTGRLRVRGRGSQKAEDWCESGTLLRLNYRENPSLAAVLTLHDRSVVNLHLMHTSYFLLLMALTLVCYALLTGTKHTRQLDGPHKVASDA